MVYIDNRSFLSANHPLRSDDQRFPRRPDQTETCTVAKPPAPSYAELIERHSLYDRAQNQSQRSFIAKSYGCKGSYAFMKLPNHDLSKQIHPDPMHTITNVITTLVSLLSGSINVSQVLCEEEEFGRRNWCHEAGPVTQGKH